MENFYMQNWRKYIPKIFQPNSLCCVQRTVEISVEFENDKIKKKKKIESIIDLDERVDFRIRSPKWRDFEWKFIFTEETSSYENLCLNSNVNISYRGNAV